MILILHENAEELAKMLDDAQLSKQIIGIAQVLCSAHHVIGSRVELGIEGGKRIAIPLPYRKYKSNEEIAKWRDWALTCRANYNKLVETGLACCEEYIYRFSPKITGYTRKRNNLFIGHNDFFYNKKFHKLQHVIEWSRDNIPDLDNKSITHMPIAIPVKYWIVEDPFPVCDLIESHKKYYRALLQKRKDQKVKCSNGYVHYEPWAPCNNTGYIQKPIVFTRRSVPDFLADLVK